MARIGYAVELDQAELATLDPSDRLSARMAAIWAHRPELKEAWDAFGAVVKAQSRLPARLIELVRLRIAFHNQCRTCMAMRYTTAIADGLTEDLVCSLETPAEADDLTDAERAALRFADLFATNHLAIADEHFAELRQYFDEGSIFELVFRCARMTGFGRMSAVFAVYEDLPAESSVRADGRHTPWGAPMLLPSG